MSQSRRPSDLAEALALRAEKNLTPYAGGTDLMPGHRRWMGLKPDLEGLLFIGHLPELQTIAEADGSMHIGACVTLSALLRDARTPDILGQIIASMAAPGVRNLATMGGNICNASPAGDTLPYLYALDAKLVAQSVSGKREIAIADFITGPGRTGLGQDEILTGVKIPLEDWEHRQHQKVAARKANALSKVSFLGLARRKDGEICDLRLAWGAVGPLVVRSSQLEQSLLNLAAKGTWPEGEPDSCLKAHAGLISPIDDQRSSAAYRRQVALGLALDFLKSLA